MAAEEDSPRRRGRRGGRAAPPRAWTRLDALELAPAPRPGRILVVDDNLFNRELLSRHLERQGHEVRAAGDGLAALELLRSEPFDVAIIDVMMPGMNGYQLLERIRAEEALRGVHAIVISALEDTQIIARCIQLGAEDYLPREFEPVILKARIESCLEKKRMKEEQELYVAALVEAQEKPERRASRGGRATSAASCPSASLSPSWRPTGISSPRPRSAATSSATTSSAAKPGSRASGKLALYLIDVSGHGIEAALFSVTLMNMLKTQVLPGADFDEPASVLEQAQRLVQMEEQNNLFFTAWYGVWDHGDEELTYASAGSPPALLVLPDGSSAELSTGGMIVGVDADARYDSAQGLGAAGLGPLHLQRRRLRVPGQGRQHLRHRALLPAPRVPGRLARRLGQASSSASSTWPRPSPARSASPTTSPSWSCALAERASRDRLEIALPDDFHAHLRRGPAMPAYARRHALDLRPRPRHAQHGAAHRVARGRRGLPRGDHRRGGRGARAADDVQAPAGHGRARPSGAAPPPGR